MTAQKRQASSAIARKLDFDLEAAFLKVLAHPVRLRILEALSEGPLCVKDLWTRLELPQATVSQHLSMLRSRGVLESERRATSVFYFIDNPTAKKIVKLLDQQRRVGG